MSAAVMAKLELSLDDIISRNRVAKKPYGKRDKPYSSIRPMKSEVRRFGEGSRRGGSITENVPSGKWKRDLYTDVDAPTETENGSSGKWKHDMFATVNSPPAKGSSGKWQRDMFTTLESTDGPQDSSASFNKKVRINISNLAPTVTSSDLKELFSQYSAESAVVHYGQNRVHLGTGEVSMMKKDAQRALKDLDGVAIDGSQLTMVIVGGESIFDRVQMIKKIDGGRVQKRFSKPLSRIRSEKKPFESRHPLDRSDENSPVKFTRARGEKRTKKPTEEELDAELDSYMRK